MNKYVIYKRKSTDSDDKQVLSLDSQDQALKEYLPKLIPDFNESDIVADYEESKSAKSPGRQKFNEMYDMIEMDGRIEGLSIKSPDGIVQILPVDVRCERTESNENTPIEKLCTEDLLSLHEDLDKYMDNLDDDGSDDGESYANELDEIDPNPGPDFNNELN